jgi:alginate O-acetyltransferase complex protein AlgI
MFLPALILLYFSIPSKYRAARNIVLLLFSLVFYAWGEPVYVFFIIFCVMLTYLASGKIAKKKK